MTTTNSPIQTETRAHRKRILRYAMGVLLIVGGLMTGIYLRERHREWVIEQWSHDFSDRGGGVIYAGVSPLGRWANEIVRQGTWAAWLYDLSVSQRVRSVMDRPILESDWPTLSLLKELTSLNVPRTKLTDGLIECLKKMPELRVLTLPDSEATDETLAKLCRALEGHELLSIVSLGKTQVTESGMQELRRLRHLFTLDLSSPHVTEVRASFQATRQKSR